MSDIINCLSWPAMRYALGRSTYVVDTVSRTLIKCKNDIRSDIRASIIKEIRKAIEDNHAGMSCDVDCWTKVIKEFENE